MTCMQEQSTVELNHELIQLRNHLPAALHSLGIAVRGAGQAQTSCGVSD